MNLRSECCSFLILFMNFNQKSHGKPVFSLTIKLHWLRLLPLLQDWHSSFHVGSNVKLIIIKINYVFLVFSCIFRI